MHHPLARRNALLLFAIVVFGWGLNWTITKAIVQSVSPLWMAAIRSGIAAVALLVLLPMRGQLIVPRRGDVPLILAITLFHMVAFSVLVAFGLQYVPVGRSVVIGYTTPLWVAPAAWLFLGEAMTKARLLGIALGVVGLALLFNPLAFDWHDRRALVGNGLILLAAVCWAVSIVYVRYHTWISTPFQLLVWQVLLATFVLAALAWFVDGAPRIVWSAGLFGAFLYGGVIGVALAYWAMATINRSLPSVTVALGLLATPVIGVATSALVFGEPLTLSLLLSMGMILSGAALGTVQDT